MYGVVEIVLLTASTNLELEITLKVFKNGHRQTAGITEPAPIGQGMVNANEEISARGGMDHRRSTHFPDSCWIYAEQLSWKWRDENALSVLQPFVSLVASPKAEGIDNDHSTPHILSPRLASL